MIYKNNVCFPRCETKRINFTPQKSVVSTADHVPEAFQDESRHMSAAPPLRMSFLKKQPKKAVPLTEAENLSMSLPEEFTGGTPAGGMSSCLLSSDLKVIPKAA